MNARDIDVPGLLQSLGVENCTSFRLLGGKFDKAVWKVDTAQGPYALRILRPGEQDAVERELAVLSLAREAGVPVASLGAQGSLDGRPVLLLSWNDGRTIAAAARARPWKVHRLGFRMGQVQARVHERAVTDTSVQWMDRFGATEDRLKERLAALPPVQHSLPHLDFHADNVVVHDGVVTGVLDWENASFGDPRADVARTWTLLSLRPREPHRAQKTATAFRRLLAHGWWRGYIAARGPLDDMPLFKAWAATALLRNMRRRYSGACWMATHGLPALAADVARLRVQAQLPERAFH